MGTVGGLVLKLSSRNCFELAPKQFENFFVLRSVTAGTNNGERIAASLVRFREEFPWDLATREEILRFPRNSYLLTTDLSYET